jgi:hypothetical protein
MAVHKTRAWLTLAHRQIRTVANPPHAQGGTQFTRVWRDAPDGRLGGPGYRSYRWVVVTSLSGFWLPICSPVMTVTIGFRYPAAAGMWIQPWWSWPATSAVTSQRKAGWPVSAGLWRTADS